MAGKTDVKVSYDEMKSTARTLQSGQRTIDDDLARLNKAVQNLVHSGFDTDKSSQKFYQSYDEFNKNATKMMANLHDMGQYLDQTADKFSATDSEMSGKVPTAER